MFVLIRTIMYVVLIGGLVALFLPAAFPSGWGLTRPEAMHVPQLVGMVLGVGGAALALLCVVAFAVVGTGTPLPFDPPRRSVVGGPYRYVRNPMAVGVSLALVLRPPINRSPCSASRGCSCSSSTRWWCGTRCPPADGCSAGSTRRPHAAGASRHMACGRMLRLHPQP
jgi:hypothetical protein